MTKIDEEQIKMWKSKLFTLASPFQRYETFKNKYYVLLAISKYLITVIYLYKYW